ncbi:MAG: hypothetical protein HYV63_04440 [Candidatus Schekmanbacteria bacterium]|nr:hypothetical protein [Candidatus Schekmanbacteria bacterium]
MRRSLPRLRTSIAGQFVGLLLLWSLLIVAWLGYQLFATTRAFFAERGAQTVRALAAECAFLVYHEDLEALAEVFARYRLAFPDIRYVAVMETSGQVLASTVPGGLPRDLLALAHRQPKVDGLSVELIRSATDGDLIYDYQFSRPTFWVRLGLSASPLSELAWSALVIGAAGSLLVFVGIVIVATRVSRPIEDLSRGMARLASLQEGGQGALSESSTWETATLAGGIHQLVEQLAERTRQLDRSKKLAYLGEISTGVVHELSNPLGVVAINSGFLVARRESGELSDGAAEEVDRLAIAVKHVTLVVRKLLQFARHATHPAAPRLRAVRLDRLVAETLELAQDRVLARGCAVRVQLPEQLGPIRCDEHGLQQVLLNLLANALDAVSGGCEIRLEAAVENGDWLVLHVTDVGAGMTEEVLRKCREPFFTTKGPEGGTGLGLAISDSIVRAHGGQLELTSAPGRGTRATVRIPIAGPGGEHGELT